VNSRPPGVGVDERGMSLVEQLIALALLGILVVTLLYALSGATVAVGVVDEQVTSLNLATSALESVRGLAYVTGTTTYVPSLAVPPGYSVTVASSAFLSATTVITGIQWVTATVTHNGRVAVQISDLKANR
jgi:prepilin-type N-terminal cleavage/methylation domain-containing protein